MFWGDFAGSRPRKQKNRARRSGHWAREAGVKAVPPPPRGQQAGIPGEWQFRGMLRPIRPRGFPTTAGSGVSGGTGTVRPGLPLERRRMVSPGMGSSRRGSKWPVSAGLTRRNAPVPKGRLGSHLASSGLGAGPNFPTPTLCSEPPLRGPGLSANAQKRRKRAPNHAAKARISTRICVVGAILHGASFTGGSQPDPADNRS